MECCCVCLKEFLETGAYIATIILAVLGIVAICQYFHTVKEFNHDVISSCMERYQEIMINLKTLKDEQGKKAYIDAYIDLTNDQLFYFQNDYLPDEVAKEWIEGMINNIGEGNYLNINSSNIQKDYPRIKGAFENIKNLPEIKDKIKRVMENLRNPK